MDGWSLCLHDQIASLETTMEHIIISCERVKKWEGVEQLTIYPHYISSQ